jgi:DNA-binding MarR family transcriptional regulator
MVKFSTGGRHGDVLMNVESGTVTPSKPLSFDPIEEARRQWVEHGWINAANGMAVVTSVMRVQQIYMARIDSILRPLNLTFARFELLTLLTFTSTGTLPMNKIGVRLQVHPTSITSIVDRLEAQGLVQRRSHETDRRTTLVKILSTGRRIQKKAVAALNAGVFAKPGISNGELEQFYSILRTLRAGEQDSAI